MNKIRREDFPPFKLFEKRLSEFASRDGGVNRIFMVKCDPSMLLAKAATLGWEISGISSDEAFIDNLREFCQREDLAFGHLIHGSIYDFDCSTLENTYDVLMNTGLLHHIVDISPFIKKWARVVKPNGFVYSCIPNCVGLNGSILRKFDPQFYDSLNRLSVESFDAVHRNAGLHVYKNAYYGKGVDMHMLIPWDKIEKRCSSIIVFKLLKYFVSFVQLVSRPFVRIGNKTVNSFIYGIYKKN